MLGTCRDRLARFRGWRPSGGGIVQDVRGRWPEYGDDWRQGCRAGTR